METVLAVSYKCRECGANFGDPERAKWNSWEMAVILHMFDQHGLKPALLNDLLLPAWFSIPICS